MFKNWMKQKSTRAGLAVLILTAVGYFSGQIQETAAIVGGASALAGMIYPEGRRKKTGKDVAI
jgi:hypothetical protein